MGVTDWSATTIIQYWPTFGVTHYSIWTLAGAHNLQPSRSLLPLDTSSLGGQNAGSAGIAPGVCQGLRFLLSIPLLRSVL